MRSKAGPEFCSFARSTQLESEFDERSRDRVPERGAQFDEGGEHEQAGADDENVAPEEDRLIHLLLVTDLPEAVEVAGSYDREDEHHQGADVGPHPETHRKAAGY